jgi:uncharacterized protein YbjT (DUF2867 family)
MAATTKIAVVGATGRVGHHIVDVLTERGHEVVPIARSLGVDVITKLGLDDALVGIDTIVDASTGPSPEQSAATEFFTTSVQNLQAAGKKAGAKHLIVISIVGTDRYAHGYGAAKIAHENAARGGKVPTRVIRATQFHEFVAQLVEWGTQGDVAYMQNMRTQLVDPRSVAEVVADVVEEGPGGVPMIEVGGPREESLVDMATLLAKKRKLPVRIEGVTDQSDPDHKLYEQGALLPGPDAILAGPTYEAWLDATSS